MSSFREDPSKLQLCEVCSEIDFEHIAPAVQVCNKARSEESSFSQHNRNLGTVQEILSRRDRCSFCAAISRHCKGFVGQCELVCEVDFCISSDQTQLRRDGPHTHTMKALVQISPDEPLAWAPLPWEIESRKTHPQRIPTILELQPGYKQLNEEESYNTPPIIGRRVLSYVDMSLLKRWLLNCEQRHVGECPHNSGTPDWESGFMPMFVIDIEKGCIELTPINCRYVALSYVWGRGKMLTHRGVNSTFLRTPGSLRNVNIPKTIRDAMTVVEALGEKYLWVDALCIIQDDVVMQQTQIAKMDQIYAKALLSIVAASGDDSESGLPGTKFTQRQNIQETIHLPGGPFYTLLGTTDEIKDLARNSTWAHRAWTMQEFLFSGRCLIFTKSQVYWRCQRAVWLEEIALEDTNSTDLDIYDYARVSFPQHVLDKYDYFELYRRTLAQYVQRNLSYQSDLINAFSGICGRLSAIHDDRFFWGLPQSQFSRSLGWEYGTTKHARNHVRTKIPTRSGTTQEVAFPTWSWAAWSSALAGTTLYLSFNGNNTFSKEKELIIGNKFLPVVDFWIADEAGRVVPILEPGTHCSSESDVNAVPPRFQWQGSEKVLPEVLTRYDTTSTHRRPGLLYFWTSVVSMNINSPGSIYISPLDASNELEELLRKKRENPEIEIIRDAVVVGRTDEAEQDGIKALLILWVEWSEGIAYRLGCQLVRERVWLACQNRQWRFITLG